MKISAQSLELIKRHEGLRLKAYLCPAGLLTVGYGHLVREHDGIKLGQTISQQTANKFLIEDVAWAENAVTRFVNHQLAPHQFGAIVSFVFNVGQTTFTRSSVLRFLNERNYPKAMIYLEKYIYGGRKKLKGLITRRAAERRLFESA